MTDNQRKGGDSSIVCLITVRTSPGIPATKPSASFRAIGPIVEKRF